MDTNSTVKWPPALLDPIGKREKKPRAFGKTMVIDKGLGKGAFEDLLLTAGEYIDVIKMGFGTSVLYPPDLLRQKIALAKEHGITVIPGGTLLEAAVKQDQIESFFHIVRTLGFNGIEVSDGTISMGRRLRKELIEQGIRMGLIVYTEYGKKAWGSRFDINELMETLNFDIECGSVTVIIEGRESGKGVGVYDEKGEFRKGDLEQFIEHVQRSHQVMWEAPLKSQQVHLIKTFGPEVNLGNISPHDILSVEALRRGLRSDTFHH